LKTEKKGKRFKRNKKKVNKKKIITILLVLLIIGGIGVKIYFSRDNINFASESGEGQKEISGKLLEEKKYKEMKVKDITLKIDESASYFRCNIENITDKRFESEDTFIVFIKEDHSELARFKYHIEEIETKGEQKISVTTTGNLVDAYDFYIEDEGELQEDGN